ncbi:hypothetical protein H9Q10_01890 [Eikenella sp. S3360]|uniref:Uncharacterized protein n=1 Tax=Eikenella glucosivorans TaxID=2766967 RepID=A0ABS0N800_9NEIS|nr:hypothetical protein [Eikenella glucosivorans]MBH5328423.1 hypothetical protein [Eikenella glucosivorans]
MKQSGAYSALRSFGYGLAIVAVIIVSFAAAVANFLLIWVVPLAFAADPDDFMLIMIFWVFMIGPLVAFAVSLYLVIKFFAPAMFFPEEDTKTKYMPYGIQDIFSLVASCIGITAIFQIQKTPFTDLVKYHWAPPLFVIWGWVVIRSVRYVVWKLRLEAKQAASQTPAPPEDRPNHSN